MAAAAAEGARRAVLERVRRFQFDRFDPHVEEWTYYIRRFEAELTVFELRGDDTMEHRRNLLLSRVGPEAFRILVDHFRPAEVDAQTYDNLKQVLHSFYAKNICITAERVVFSQRHRKEGESVTQFLNSLRSLAGNCDFGVSLAERLRDQLVIGIGNDAWQKELFRLHPTNAATLAEVEATVIVLEQASLQQQRLHSLTKGKSAAAAGIAKVAPSTSSSKHRQPRQQQQPQQQPRLLLRGKHYFKSGNRPHEQQDTCPAEAITCSACHKKGHYARVCVKAGNAEIVTSQDSRQVTSGSAHTDAGRRRPGNRKRLNKVAAAESDDDDDCLQDNDDSDSESYDQYDDLHVIHAIQKHTVQKAGT